MVRQQLSPLVRQQLSPLYACLWTATSDDDGRRDDGRRTARPILHERQQLSPLVRQQLSPLYASFWTATSNENGCRPASPELWVV